MPPKTYKVSCLCGADIAVDPRSERRAVDCPKCGVSVDFVVSIDPKFKSPRVSIVLPRSAFASFESPSEDKGGAAAQPKPEPKTRKGEPQDAPAGDGLATSCTCGATLIVDAEELTSVQTCTLCGTAFHVVLKRVPGSTRKEVILVPKKIAPSRKSIMAPSPPPSARAGATRLTQKQGPRTKVTTTRAGGKTVAPRKNKSSGEAPPGSQFVLCRCGETLLVYRKDVGRDIPCRGCGTLLHLHETLDPQTLRPKVEATPVRKRP
jgi:hypothetical protein